MVELKVQGLAAWVVNWGNIGALIIIIRIGFGGSCKGSIRVHKGFYGLWSRGLN